MRKTFTLNKKELNEARKKIRHLSREQDAIFNNFLKKNGVPKNCEIADCVLDYCFNGDDYSLVIAKEIGAEIK